MAATAPASVRPRLEGTRKILRFNWPLYATGAVACVAAAVPAVLPALPAAVRAAAAVAAIGAAYLVLASSLVSWWVYDHSGLHHWEWLLPGPPPAAVAPAAVAPLPGRPPAASPSLHSAAPSGPMGRWALCHAGLDEAGPELAELLGEPLAVLDIGAGLPRWSGSLRRARKAFPSRLVPLVASPGALPVDVGALDAVVLVFAAHEVRRHPQRVALFGELARVVRPGGTVALVEHPRDLANLVAFGPGAWHFYSRREWLAIAQGAGFDLAAELHQTPFVRGFVLCRR